MTLFSWIKKGYIKLTFYLVTGTLFVAQNDLRSFMRDWFDMCFTDYRPTSHLQQLKCG